MPRSGPITRFVSAAITPTSRPYAAPSAISAPARHQASAAASRPVLPSNAPTPVYRQHHDVAAPQIDRQHFRPPWRVTTRLDGLLEAGRIDREQWDAACLWRHWFDTITPSRVQPWEIRVDTPMMPNDTGMLLRVQTVGKLRVAADALGPLRIKLLEWAVGKDSPWAQIARFMRVSDKTARDHTVEAIAALADWQAGRTVAPPPLLRYRIEPGRQ